MDIDADKVLDSVEALVPADGDTYLGDDGLLYCSRCGTRRQTRIEIFDKVRTVRCVCKCMAEAIDREDEQRRQASRMLNIRRFRDAGFDDDELKDFTFDNDDGSLPQITRAMQAYVENFPQLRESGKGLLLYGNVGTGKTYMAACVVNALIDRGHPCLMTSFSRLTNKLSGMWEGKQEYIDALSRFDLVAIDDLGAERDTEYMNEQVTSILDSLYRAKVPMVITSNYGPKDLAGDCEIQKRRAYDRLLERCHPVKVDGPSRRKNMGRASYHDMNKLLGL